MHSPHSSVSTPSYRTLLTATTRDSGHGRQQLVVVGVKFFNKNFVKRKVDNHNIGIQYGHTK